LLTRCSLRVNGLLHQLSQQIQQQQLIIQQQLLFTPSDETANGGLLAIQQPQHHGGAPNNNDNNNNMDNGDNNSLHTASQLSQSDVMPVGSTNTGNMNPQTFMPMGMSGQVFYYTEIYQLLEQSDIYLSNQNEKLFLSIPLEEFVFTFMNNQQQFGMNESTVNSLFSPESSKILNDYPPMKSPSGTTTSQSQQQQMRMNISANNGGPIASRMNQMNGDENSLDDQRSLGHDDSSIESR
jgi:hypothetical protein